MKQLKLLTLIPVLALAGCASVSQCSGTQAYRDATSVPVVQSTESLKLKDSPSALKIPPAPATAVPYGEVYVDEDGDERVRCLDIPPVMPAPLPEAPKPAEKAP
ncbi:MAG: hypothetical protein ACT4PK_03245 [Gammaproteobacteria bacterium]